MYYDTYEGRGRRRRSRNREYRRGGGCGGWLAGLLFKLLVFALMLAVLAAALLYVMPVGFMNVEPDGMELSPTDGLPNSRVNVLLLGLDALGGGQRSDVMIVASVGYDGVRLTSLMRDTLVDIPGHGRTKLNAAYAYGGAELAMRTVNQNFQLNITNYVAADFRALVDLIDAVGGVEVEVDEGELKYLNHYAHNTYKKLCLTDADKYARYADSAPVAQTGRMLLNGLFATGYCRIRYSDNDYVRTSRHREVLGAMLARLRENCWNPLVYVRLLQALSGRLKTNMYLPELISLGEKALVSGRMDTFRLPMEPYLYDNNSSIEITDWPASINALYTFIYGD